MEKIDINLMGKLNNMIDEATKAEEYKLATALGKLQIEIIEERTKAWESGYDAGFSMGVRKSGLLCRVNQHI
jgi:flagellar biosynthesis/type III secretory pathway protein FliH